MAPFTASVARFITTPHRVLTRGGATWKYTAPSTENAVYLGEIPPAMQSKLRRQGVVLPLLAGALSFALDCVTQVYGNEGDWQGAIQAKDLASFAFSGFIIAGFLYAFRTVRRFPLHREVRYRYRHGKWRWER